MRSLFKVMSYTLIVFNLEKKKCLHSFCNGNFIALMYCFCDNVVCACADTSSASEDEGSLRRRQAAVSAVLAQSLQNSEFWINRSIQGSSTSSSASSTLSHGDGSKNHIQNTLADVLAHTRIGTPTPLTYFIGT